MPIVNPFGKKSGKFSGKGVPVPDFAPFCRPSFCRLLDAGALPALRRNGLAVEKAEEDLAHLFESLRVAEVKFEYAPLYLDTFSRKRFLLTLREKRERVRR